MKTACRNIPGKQKRNGCRREINTNTDVKGIDSKVRDWIQFLRGRCQWGDLSEW
jgi:hypothetical protein